MSSLSWCLPMLQVTRFSPRHIAVEFNVNGQGTTLYGDGFAVWYTNGIQSLGDVFGSADSFRGLGVFFDTVRQPQHCINTRRHVTLESLNT